MPQYPALTSYCQLRDLAVPRDLCQQLCLCSTQIEFPQQIRDCVYGPDSVLISASGQSENIPKEDYHVQRSQKYELPNGDKGRRNQPNQRQGQLTEVIS